jgi:hypothetical protein
VAKKKPSAAAAKADAADEDAGAGAGGEKKKVVKKKVKSPDAAPPEPPKPDPEIKRREVEAKVKAIRDELAKQKRLTQRGEQELESLRREHCIRKAMQSHINDATLREHDELIEDMIDTLFECVS